MLMGELGARKLLGGAFLPLLALHVILLLLLA